MYPWFQVDSNIGAKPDVLKISRCTDCSRETTVGRLVLFWCLVDQFGDIVEDESLRPRPELDGLLRDYAVVDLITLAGGDAAFWEAVVSSGWMLETEAGLWLPGFEERFSENAKRRHAAAKRQQKKRRLADQPAPKLKKKTATKAAEKRAESPVTSVTRDRDSRREEKRREERTEEPPPPPKTAPPVAVAGAAFEGWTDAAKAISSAGVSDVQGSIAAAKELGRVPSDVIADARAWTTSEATRFDSPAALAFRVRNGRWPKPTTRQAGQTERDRLERRHGALLASLSREAERELCEAAGVVFDVGLGGFLARDRLQVLRFLDQGQEVPA